MNMQGEVDPCTCLCLAITNREDDRTILNLIKCNSRASKIEFQGNLPLHHTIVHNALIHIIEALIKSYSEAVWT